MHDYWTLWDGSKGCIQSQSSKICHESYTEALLECQLRIIVGILETEAGSCVLELDQ